MSKQNYDVYLPWYRVEKTYDFRSLANARSWGVGFLKAPKVWEMGYTGAGVIAIVGDTEDGAVHPDVAPVVVPEYCHRWTNEPTSLRSGKLEIPSAGGHGLHVTDTIRQVAPGAVLGMQKLLTNFGSGMSTWVAKGIVNTADMPSLPEHEGFPRVLNLSIGSNSPSQIIREALEYVISKGVFVCAAAGNDGKQGVDFPAAWAELCITTAALKYMSEQITDFSSHGPGILVDVAAPGERVTAAYQDKYADLTGTSMASPHVAGIVCLILQAYPEIRHQSELEEVLRSRASDILKPGMGEKEGAGVPYAINYMRTTSPDPEPEPEPDPEPDPGPEPDPKPDPQPEPSPGGGIPVWVVVVAFVVVMVVLGLILFL